MVDKKRTVPERPIITEANGRSGVIKKFVGYLIEMGYDEYVGEEVVFRRFLKKNITDTDDGMKLMEKILNEFPRVLSDYTIDFIETLDSWSSFIGDHLKLLVKIWVEDNKLEPKYRVSDKVLCVLEKGENCKGIITEVYSEELSYSVTAERCTYLIKEESIKYLFAKILSEKNREGGVGVI